MTEMSTNKDKIFIIRLICGISTSISDLTWFMPNKSDDLSVERAIVIIYKTDKTFYNNPHL